jgi:hypothetical protein
MTTLKLIAFAVFRYLTVFIVVSVLLSGADLLVRLGHPALGYSAYAFTAVGVLRFLYREAEEAPRAIAAAYSSAPTSTPSADLDADWADIEIQIAKEKSQ